MARLTTEAREHLPAKTFAGPHKSYPIPDKKHARAAEMDINKDHLTPAQKTHVLAMAHAMLRRGVKK